MNLFETNLTLRSGGYVLLMALLAVGVTSCDLTDVSDQSPNEATDATATKVLNSAQVGAILFQDGNHARVTSFFTEQLNGASRQYAGQDRSQYSVTASDVDNLWITGYADAIGDLEVVKNKATAPTERRVLGIAQATQALTFGTKASLHGDIPASEALQGDENLDPAFDSQLRVYDDFVIAQLENAITNIEAGGNDPGQDDVFFDGEIDPWVEAAHTLKARYMLHVAHVDQGPVSDYTFQDVYDAAQDGISSADNNLTAPHGPTNEVNANPFWQFRDDRGDDLDAAGSYAARLLDPNSSEYRGDAKSPDSLRFDFYFFDDGGYDMAGNASTDEDRELQDLFFAKDQDFPIATWAENELIEAEAALHADGQSFNDALTALNNARTAIEQQFGGTFEDYDASDFQSGNLLNPNGNLSQEEALLKEILEEKYLVLIGNIEAFADLRRTNNFAEVQDPANNVLEFNGSGDAPERFPYAQSEVTGNANVPDPIPGLFTEVPAFGVDYPTP